MSIKLRQNIYDSFQFTYIILCLIILILLFINSIYNTNVVFSKSYDKILKDIKKNISVSSLKDYKILCNYYIDDNFKYNDILLSMNVYNDIFTSYSYFTIAYVIFIIVILAVNFTSNDKIKDENDFLFFNINYYNFSIEDTNTNTNYMKLLLILIPIICFILFIVYMGLYGAIINEKKIYDYRLAYNTTESIEQLIFNDYITINFADDKAYYTLLNHILNNNNKYNFIDLCPTADIKRDINGTVKYFIDKMAKANGITIDKSSVNEVPKYIFLHNILHMCAILCKINENTNVDVVKTFRDFFKKCEYYNTHSNLPEQWQTYGNKINSDIHLTFYELISKNINSFIKIFVDIKDNTYAEEKDIYASKVIFLHSLLTKYYLDNYEDENINNLISSDDNNSYARKLLGKKDDGDKNASKEKDFFKNKIKFFKGITLGMIMTNLVITSILFLIIFGFFQDKFKKILDIFKYTDTINYLLTLLIKNSHKYTIIIPILISILNFINDYFHIVIPVIILMLIILFIILISTLT